MTESEKDQEQSSPAAESPAPVAPAGESPATVDSITFSRCAGCRFATQVNSAAGTLICNKHNMCVNAEADEIPDDCTEFEE